MTDKINLKKRAGDKRNLILFIALLGFGFLLLTAPDLRAQTPSPTPAKSDSDEKVMIGDYEITSSVELGVRGLEVNGNHEKYRSDFNYRPGFRIFDSSFTMEAEKGKGKFFDSLQIITSGWNADPTGSVRVNVEKMGAYRFDSNVRQVSYYNQLVNHAYGWKGADTRRNFGDFDLTVLPQNENFRLRFGTSFYRASGTAGFTTRPFSDEFPVTRLVDVNSTDYRAGVDTKLAGFKMSLSYGFRRFEDDTDFTLLAPNQGANTTNTSVLTAFERLYPIHGDTKYGVFTVQRTFAERLDFTGRFIYSNTDRKFDLNERVFGRDASNNVFDPDRYFIFGDVKRTQSRGDLGVTYAVTDKFRISNSFSFDQFNSSGDSRLSQVTISRTAAGAPRTVNPVNTLYYRTNGFKRYANTIEGDYQFSPKFGINIGYRFTHRQVDIEGFNRPLAPSTALPTIVEEEEENSTNTLLVGTRYKPLKNWSIFADIEHGEADNAFTRLANYNYTNFRVRSNFNYKQFTFNVSAISRDNENPSQTSAITNTTTGAVLIPAGELLGNVKNRVFSANVDWSPDPKFTLSTGYTYHHLTSETDIVVPLAILTPGFSEFYMRDSYAFVDVSAQPIKRVSVFASYRFDRDTGQGDRISTAPQFIISSYPYRLNMPEIRVAVRLTKNIDWNVGYQYYGYRENLERAYFDPVPPNQNYNAHMPYTSLRIYFGGGDRGR